MTTSVAGRKFSMCDVVSDVRWFSGVKLNVSLENVEMSEFSSCQGSVRKLIKSLGNFRQRLELLLLTLHLGLCRCLVASCVHACYTVEYDVGNCNLGATRSPVSTRNLFGISQCWGPVGSGSPVECSSLIVHIRRKHVSGSPLYVF